MKKTKQIFAWIGIVLLLGLYIITFILAVTGNEHTQGLLMASLACTVIIPCLIYAMMLIAKILGKKSDSVSESLPKSSTPDLRKHEPDKKSNPTAAAAEKRQKKDH